MPEDLTGYRIFIASPSGLDDIRKSFKERLQFYNETDANARGVHFKPIGWEITLAGVGRPQELINNDIKKCDYFVLVLHDRWGSPPSNETEYTSGTEEEFNIALECLHSNSHPMKDMVLFFRAVNPRQLSDPGEQLSNVLSFKRDREIKKDLLYHSFDSQSVFEDFLNRHLAKWVRNHEEENGIHGQLDIDVDASMSPVINRGIEKILDTNLALRKAQDCVEQKRYVEAEIEFSKLIVKGHNPEALALYGRFLRKLGQLDRASSIIDTALDQTSSQQYMQIRAFTLHQKARVLEEQGHLIRSTDEFRKSVVLSEMCNDPQGAAKSSRSLAKVLKKRGLLDEAQHELNKALDYYKAANDPSGEAGTLGYLGVILKSRGDFPEAEKMHRSALEIQKSLGNEGAVAIALGNLGAAVRLQGRALEGFQYHKEALAIHERIGDLKSICRELSNLGTASRYLSNLEDSENFHNKAFKICEDIGDKNGIAIQHGCLAQIHLQRHQFDEAEKHHLKSLQLSQEMKDVQGESIQLKSLGNLYRLTGNLDKALVVLEKGLKIDSERGFKFGIGKAQSGIGKIMILKEKYEQARKYFSDALSQFVESSATQEIHETEHILKLIDSNSFSELNSYLK